MPDVQEVFRMATQKVLPDPGALERQNRNQRRRSTQRKAGAYALVAALVAIGIAVALVTLPNHGAKTQKPASSPSGPLSGPILSPHRVAIVGLDGIVQREIPGLAEDAYAPSLSPDGTKIAYLTSSKTIGLCGGCGWRGPRIVVVGLDGSDSHYVGEQLAGPGGGIPSWSANPRWSPDGSRIAYAGWDPTGRTDNVDIYVVGVDGEGLHKLTDDPGTDEWPSWSPDGSRIVYTNSGATPLDGSGFSPTSEIYTISSSGGIDTDEYLSTGRNVGSVGKPTRLTNNDAIDTQPEFSPDGRQIAFLRDDRIWVMNADGAGGHNIVALRGDFAPRWSPDGSRIAFLNYDDSWRAALDLGGATAQDWPVLTVKVVDVKTGDLQGVGGAHVATHWNTPGWFPTGDALFLSLVERR